VIFVSITDRQATDIQAKTQKKTQKKNRKNTEKNTEKMGIGTQVQLTTRT